MNPQENDPDTLQILDESDKEWVKLWRKAKLKKTTSNTTIYVVPNQENINPALIKKTSKS